jgi:hypothetical protein
MEYRGIEYAIVEGIGGHLWKWSASAGVTVVTDRAHSKQAAMVSAERLLIGLSPSKKSDLSHPSDSIETAGRSQYWGLRRLSTVSIEASFGG